MIPLRCNAGLGLPMGVGAGKLSCGFVGVSKPQAEIITRRAVNVTVRAAF